MNTRVCFVEDESNALALEIQAPLHHPLTDDLENRLRPLGIRVVDREMRMGGEGVELKVHLTEIDGTALTSERRLQVQTLLLAFASPAETPPSGIVAIKPAAQLKKNQRR